MKKVHVVAVLVAVVAIAAASIFILKPNQKKEAPSSSAPSHVTIKYSDSGFDPTNVTVKTGGQLTVTNTSSETVDFDSGPHPEHTDNPELNIGPIQPGQSRTITVKNQGEWSFHNHLDATQGGFVIIQ